MKYHIWTVGCQMNVADSRKLAAGLDRVMEIHAESVDRIRRGDSQDTIPAELVVMHFRRATREARTRITR